VKVKILPVVHYQELDRSKTHEEWAEKLRASLYIKKAV
jgi:hypothetical protein